MIPLDYKFPEFDIDEFGKGGHVETEPKPLAPTFTVILPEEMKAAEIPFTEARIEELQKVGEKMFVKVSRGIEREGKLTVNIRDFVFSDYVRAAHYLRQIDATENVHPRVYLA